MNVSNENIFKSDIAISSACQLHEILLSINDIN